MKVKRSVKAPLTAKASGLSKGKTSKPEAAGRVAGARVPARSLNKSETKKSSTTKQPAKLSARTSQKSPEKKSEVNQAQNKPALSSLNKSKAVASALKVEVAVSKSNSSKNPVKAPSKPSLKEKLSAKKLSTKVTVEKKRELSPEELAEIKEAQIAKLILDHRENGRKLSRSILRRWRVRMPAEEVDSLVDLALCEAARRYSADFGASFMTFLFYHLRGHLVRAVARAAQGNNIFLSFARNAGIDSGDLTHLGGSVSEMALPEFILFNQRDIETPENLLLREETIGKCRDALSKLDQLEREILDRSFGGDEALVDIAKYLGYSRCHVSRVKKSAMGRLKNILGGSELNMNLDETVREEDGNGLRQLSAERRLAAKRNRRKISGKKEALELKENLPLPNTIVAVRAA